MTADTTPWSDEQIRSLMDYQHLGFFHPFTCGTKEKHNHPDDDAVLVATRDGWVCPCCDYTQKWAHDFMMDGSWRKMIPAAVLPYLKINPNDGTES